jgi:hypothetical protein
VGAGVVGPFEEFRADVFAFHHAGIGPVTACAGAVATDLSDRLADRVFQAVRGKNPPGW